MHETDRRRPKPHAQNARHAQRARPSSASSSVRCLHRSATSSERPGRLHCMRPACTSDGRTCDSLSMYPERTSQHNRSSPQHTREVVSVVLGQLACWLYSWMGPWSPLSPRSRTYMILARRTSPRPSSRHALRSLLILHSCRPFDQLCH
jgi:hypothetical protein